MVGVSKKTPEEWEDKKEKERAYNKKYCSDPVVKARQKEYHKTYDQDPMNKESHRQSQRRYRMTAKGRACDERAWKNRGSKTKKNKESNDNQ